MIEADLSIINILEDNHEKHGGLSFVTVGKQNGIVISPNGFYREVANKNFYYTPDPFPETKLYWTLGKT